MASYSPAKRATAWIGYVSLVSQADTKLMKSAPTIAAGDFKVSLDGGTLNNLTTLPTVTPASSVMVKISLSAAEMTADNVTVVCIDAAGAEWCDLVLTLQPSVAQIDDLATAANLATLAGYVDTEVAAIKAKTDNLPVDPADASDIAASFTTVNATLATIDGRIDTEVAAIKAKTDNLPTDPADASDIAASFTAVNATLATISGKTTNLPSDPADASDIAAAFATVNGTLATINAKTTNLPAAPAATGDAMTLTAGERTAVADALLNRNLAAVSVTNTRSPINALRILRNKVSVPLGTVFAEDDTTTAWTFAVTTDAAAVPITVVDPA